jgi:hypothetical protein
MVVIRHHGRPAAWVSASRIRLFPVVEALESEHPARRWVTCLAVFTQEVLTGELPGPYGPGRTERLVRDTLIPDAEFLALAACQDVVLAEHFNVPLEQITEKRQDLLALGWGDLAAPPR